MRDPAAARARDLGAADDDRHDRALGPAERQARRSPVAFDVAIDSDVALYAFSMFAVLSAAVTSDA